MKLSKKVIAIALASTMAITPAGNVLHTFGIHTEATTMAASTISTYDQLVAACAKSGTYTLTKSIKCTKPVSVTANVTIKSTTEDNIIYAGSEMSQVFYVDGGTLNLGETGDSARTAVRGGTTDTAYTTKAVVTVDNGGTLNVNAAHIYRSNGNGIRVQGKSKCTMNNGNINGVKPLKSIGGAVYVLEESTFNLKSGSITGNTCGGVTVNKGSIFNMTGGTISTNTGGGGNPTSSDSKTGYGGGVYLAGTFKMSGGVIKSNTASYGKGVYIVDNANMYVSGDMLIDSSENNGNDVRLQSKDANIVLEGNLSKSPAMRVTLPSNTPGTVVAKAANSLMDISGFITNQNFIVSNQGDSFITKSADGLSLVLSKNCKITYNAMGGNTTTTTQDCQWGEVATVAAAPSRDGYSFIGWNTDADGNGTSYSPNASITVQEDITLYAQWRKIVYYTVNYDTDGGYFSGNANQRYETGSIVNISLDIPKKIGYIFTGWNTSKDGSGASYSAGNSFSINSDVTLYAQWIEDTSGITNTVIEQYAPVLKASVSGTYVKIKWAFTGEVTGYEIEVNSAATKNKYKKVATVSETSSSYIDSALKQGKNAKIRVRAYVVVNGKKYYSRYSNVESKTILKKASLKTVRYAKKTKKASIQWSAPAGVSGVEIYQKIGKGKYKKIYTAKGTSKKIVISLAKVKKGKKISYKIRYCKKSGSTKVYSAYSNVKTVKKNN